MQLIVGAVLAVAVCVIVLVMLGGDHDDDNS